jgi:hypothetical protein
MAVPDYVKILKLDKLAMKSKSRGEYLTSAQKKLPAAKTLGVAESFEYFVDEAWKSFGTGQ